MAYTMQDVFTRLGDLVDVVYIIDVKNDTYTTLKDNELFHSVYGDGGSYAKLLEDFLQSSLDKRVAKDTPYGVFSQKASMWGGPKSGNTSMRIGGRQIFISMNSFPLDDEHTALIITKMSETDYEEQIHSNQSMNVIKTAYLFTMTVDLVADKCGAISMSETEVTPATFLDIKYSEWRDMIINMFLPADHEMFRSMTDPDFLRKNLSYERSKSVDCQMMNIEGQFIWVKLIFHRINTGNDEDFKFIFMVEDIHDSHNRLMEEVEKFEELAIHDSLTGLLNRSGIESEIGVRAAKSREERKPVSLIMLDIDFFKKVNDTYGHQEGDQVIRKITGIAEQILSANGGTLGRWGGEEFIGVPADTDRDKAAEIAECIRVAVSEADFGVCGPLTISAGVIEVQANDTLSSSFERVDAALY